MKKSLRCFLIAAIVLGGGLVSSGPSLFASDTHPEFSVTFPASSIDLGDLDLRDGQNRPIRNFAEKKRMESLFIRGLNQLLLTNMTPGKRQVLLMLAAAWDVTSGVLRRAFLSTWHGVESWFQDRKVKKFRFSDSFGYVGRYDGYSSEPILASSGSRFLYLIEALISSTRILR